MRTLFSHGFFVSLDFFFFCYVFISDFICARVSDKANLEKIDFSESYDHSNPDAPYENADDYDMPDKAGIMT